MVEQTELVADKEQITKILADFKMPEAGPVEI